MNQSPENQIRTFNQTRAQKENINLEHDQNRNFDNQRQMNDKNSQKSNTLENNLMNQKQEKGSAKKDEAIDQLQETLNFIDSIHGPSSLQMNEMNKNDKRSQPDHLMLIEHDQSLMNSQMSEMHPNLNLDKTYSTSNVSAMISDANQIIGRHSVAQKPPSVPKKASQKRSSLNNIDRTLHDSSAQIINERRIIDCNNLGSKAVTSQVSGASSARRGYKEEFLSLGASLRRKQGGQSAGRQHLKKQNLANQRKNPLQAPSVDINQSIDANLMIQESSQAEQHTYQSSPQVLNTYNQAFDSSNADNSADLNKARKDQMKGVNRSHDPRSKKFHKMHKRQSTQISGISRSDLMNLPGGPLLKAAADANILQNKSQMLKMRSKSKKAQSKDSYLLKAYLPQIVHKKDIILVANPNKSQSVPKKEHTSPQVVNVMDLAKVVQYGAADLKDQAQKTRYSYDQQDFQGSTTNNTALDNSNPVVSTSEQGFQIVDENQRKLIGLADNKEMKQIRKQNSDIPTRRQEKFERRRNSELSPEKNPSEMENEHEFKSKIFPPIKKNMKNNRQKSQNRASNTFATNGRVIVSPTSRPSNSSEQPQLMKADARDQTGGAPNAAAKLNNQITSQNTQQQYYGGVTSPQSISSDLNGFGGKEHQSNDSSTKHQHQRLSSQDDQPNSHPQVSRKQNVIGNSNQPTTMIRQQSHLQDNTSFMVPDSLLIVQMGSSDNQYNWGNEDDQVNQQPKKDFERQNQEKLRQMQEERNRELQEIENQRAKMLRRQEKLKQNILREAQIYKEQKALRAQKEAQEKEKQQPIKLTNQKSAGNSKSSAPFKSQVLNSPERSKTKSQQQSPPSSGPRLQNQTSSAGVTHPPNQSASALAAQEVMEDDGKTPEERAEEKKRLDMMRKFYRNRYHTFLKQLQEEKAKKEEEQKAVQDKALRKKEKVKNLVLGDADKIKARVFEEKKEVQQEQIDPDMFKPQINPVKPAKAIKPIRHRSRSRSITRGHTASNSLVVAEKAYITDKEGNSTLKRENGGSRGSTRAASSSQKTMTANTDASRVQASRTATNFTGTRGRTLTPKAREATKRDLLGRNKNATQDLHMAALSPEDQMAFDETREEEMLKLAAEKKARAQKIRERQDKQLMAIKEKLAKEKQKEVEEEQRKLKLKELARQNVLMRADELKNMPTLREQQDSRLQKKRKEAEQAKTSPNRGQVAELKPVNPESIKAFLQRNLKTKEVFLNITDINQWKKKHRVEPETKVFICKGGYKDIKRALKQRGWVENKDGDSLCFDLKWMLKSKDIPTNDLTPNQIVNHFYKATSITTKVGLTHSLKNLIWFNAVDIDTFYPRCYDLGIEEEQEDFVQEFKQAKAQCYLKIYIREMREAYEAADGDVSKLKSKTVNSKLFKVAMRVCSQRTRELDDLIDDPNGFEALVSESDWKILGADELNEETFLKKKHDLWNQKNQTEAQKRARKEAKDKEKKDALKKKQEEDDQDDKYYDEEYDAEYDEEEANEIIVPEDENKETQGGIVESSIQDEIDAKIGLKYPEFAVALKVMKALRDSQPQFDLDGERNIWILKPAGSSRGRGICLKKDLVEIMDFCKQKETQYICQKYIENSLLILNRKFDIRQWVLVTDWNPLTIWLYAEPYIRFPAADFSFDNLTNRYAHLSNNSVAKHGKKVKITHHIEGNMWTLDEFQENLEQTYGFNVWEDKIQEGIKNIVIHSLESVQDMFEVRKGQQFELFGYDIMIDEKFNCWLIEVNSSPAMDYSTHVTERLVKMVSEDTIKVVVDYASAPQKKKSKIDTGLYECIYKAKRIVDKPMGSFGLNLEVQGKKIPKNHLKKY